MPLANVSSRGEGFVGDSRFQRAVVDAVQEVAGVSGIGKSVYQSSSRYWLNAGNVSSSSEDVLVSHIVTTLPLSNFTSSAAVDPDLLFRAIRANLTKASQSGRFNSILHSKLAYYFNATGDSGGGKGSFSSISVTGNISAINMVVRNPVEQKPPSLLRPHSSHRQSIFLGLSFFEILGICSIVVLVLLCLFAVVYFRRLLKRRRARKLKATLLLTGLNGGNLKRNTDTSFIVDRKRLQSRRVHGLMSVDSADSQEGTAGRGGVILNENELMEELDNMMRVHFAASSESATTVPLPLSRAAGRRKEHKEQPLENKE